MKMQLMFSRFNFGIGVFWDKRLRTLTLFLLPMLGLRFSFARTAIVELPPSDEETLLKAIDATRGALWSELCLAAGFSASRAAIARRRLMDARVVEERRIQFVDTEGQSQSRRVLARVDAAR